MLSYDPINSSCQVNTSLFQNIVQAATTRMCLGFLLIRLVRTSYVIAHFLSFFYVFCVCACVRAVGVRACMRAGVHVCVVF